MRRIGLHVVSTLVGCALVGCALVGCAKLSGAYDPATNVDSEGSSDSEDSQPSDPTTASPSTTTLETMSGDGTGPGTTTTSGPGETGTGPGTVSTSGDSSSDGDAETGNHDTSVLLVWVSPQTLQLGTLPKNHCQDNLSSATAMCDVDPRAILGTSAQSFEDVLLSFDGEPEVYGLHGDGSMRIAESPSVMLDGLDATLAAAGTGLSEGQFFWTGSDLFCEDWTSPVGDSTYGTASSATAAWHAVGSASCSEDLRILCGCRALENPFR